MSGEAGRGRDKEEVRGTASRGRGSGRRGNRCSGKANFTSTPLPDTDQQHALSYLYTLFLFNKLSAQICEYLTSSHVRTQYYLVLRFGKFTNMNVRPSVL